ncbi:MAG: glycerol-3-phosphate 1-O-acyltransferase PlsY [Dissulfuribacterales bacterium]
MDWLQRILFCVGAYLLGSIPFGLLIGKAMGTDIRKHGSGNIGATNVTRTLGRKLGILTLSLDVLKGWLPVIISANLLQGQENFESILSATALCAFLGHCYSIFLRFQGGKGVATAAGVFLAICPQALAIALLSFIIVVWRTGFVSAGSLTAALVMPLLQMFFLPSLPVSIATWTIAALVWWKHRDNIQRLLRGKEKGWKKQH